MSDSCHLDRASNVKIGVECQIFVNVIFFNCSRVLQFGAHSRYYKGALTQKRSFLVICTTFRSAFHVSWRNQNKLSTLNLSFNALSKWHEPDIRIDHFTNFSTNLFVVFPLAQHCPLKSQYIFSSKWGPSTNIYLLSQIWKFRELKRACCCYELESFGPLEFMPNYDVKKI